MLKLATLRHPRNLAAAAAFVLAAALPGAGMLSAAHAAPAIPPTTLSTSISGPSGSASGATASYTMTITNALFGATAVAPQYAMEFNSADVTIMDFNSPEASCAVHTSGGVSYVLCSGPDLAVGDQLFLRVNVMFTGATGVETVVVAADAANAPFAESTMQTTVVAQSNFGGAAPGPLYPGTSGFGGGNG